MSAICLIFPPGPGALLQSVNASGYVYLKLFLTSPRAGSLNEHKERLLESRESGGNLRRERGI